MAAIELQIGPSSINKQEWDTPVTTMFTTFWPLKVGTIHERKILLKKYQNARSFFLSHTTELNQQKPSDVVSKSTAKIYPSNKYNTFPSFIIDESWNTLQLKNIVLSFQTPFEPITALFTITGLWPKPPFHWTAISLRFEILVKMTRIVAETARAQ